MKKGLKIFLISLGALVAAAILVVCVVLWIVFTPEKITPIVRNEAAKLIACRWEIGSVEMTFFSTFPKFGLEIKGLTVINPFPGAPCDTLVGIRKLRGAVDIEALRKNKELILSEIYLSDGKICAFIDDSGKANFDIFFADTTEFALNHILADNIRMTNIDLCYMDEQSKMKVHAAHLKATMKGFLQDDMLQANISVDAPETSLAYNGEQYLNHTPLKMDLLSDINLLQQSVNMKELSLSVSGMTFHLSGSVANDTLTHSLVTDLSYQWENWSLKTLAALAPPSLSAYLKGMEIDGKLSSEGTLKGIYNDSVMPSVNLHLTFKDGMLKHAGLPFPLKAIYADIDFDTDRKDDLGATLRINHFSADTPQSSVKITGKADKLFSDNIHADLKTDAGLVLSEFAPLLPGNMKVAMNGMVSGSIQSGITLNNRTGQPVAVEDITLSGSLKLHNLDIMYDTLSLQTHSAQINFALPHVKNTNQLLPFVCDFRFDDLKASVDTISISMIDSSGKLSIEPKHGKAERQKIDMVYNGGKLLATMGKDSLTVDKIDLKMGAAYAGAQQDLFLQWMPRGFVDMKGAKASVSAFPYPVEIPVLNMEFNPKEFHIAQADVTIDKSDFSLSGKLSNLLSSYRGDSILRGEFTLVSTNTDVSQLMEMTNGLGSSEKDSMAVASGGPYMVPSNMDMLLHSRIGCATMGSNMMHDFKGDVRVCNGLLVLDDLTFSLSGADMQLTAMYRTPRKNHLYAGFDFHIPNVEIDQMLEMVPDLDSIMPMLRSFRGEGELHIAAETYMDSLYNIKMSTLRGASFIKGKNLVLMDGETFDKIAKTLRFNKQAANKVDSLSVEFTIFRNEIDVYPFLIVMDKYKAIIGGRHNLDMSFDYNITVVESPLPFRLALDAKGTLDDLKIRLAKSKYPEMYRPVVRKEVEKRRLELRSLIRNSLIEKIH